MRRDHESECLSGFANDGRAARRARRHSSHHDEVGTGEDRAARSPEWTSRGASTGMRATWRSKCCAFQRGEDAGVPHGWSTGAATSASWRRWSRRGQKTWRHRSIWSVTTARATLGRWRGWRWPERARISSSMICPSVTPFGGRLALASPPPYCAIRPRPAGSRRWRICTAGSAANQAPKATATRL
ncbi:unnamed protein product [Phaeothamnion confervicola]